MGSLPCLSARSLPVSGSFVIGGDRVVLVVLTDCASIVSSVSSVSSSRGVAG